MANTIQIVVAGLLILAWIWVLGRPLMARRPTAYEEFLAKNPDRAPAPDPPGPAGAASLNEPPAEPWFELVRRWWNRPAEVWRRQFLLASLLAAFVSFLLAVALRTTMGSTFVYLFVLMVIGLVIHLAVAARLGRRMLEQRETEVAAATARARVRPGSVMIRAGTVGGAEPVADVTDSAFDMAADIASALGQDSKSVTIDRAAEVSGLIESEWGDEDAPDPSEQKPTTDSAAPKPNADGADAQPSADGAVDRSTAGDGGGGDGSDALFRRAAIDDPGRARRKPKPIYIESQLDDGDGGPKAVNFP